MRGKNLGQRTLKDSVILYGQCLHSGVKSGLILEPLPANSGIHFAEIGGSRPAPVFVENVESTDFATTVRAGDTSAATIEHLMSALHSYGISNLLVKCNGEVPIFDGSALEFCDVIESVGLQEQDGDWYEIAVDRKIELFDSDDPQQQLSLEPSEVLSIEYTLDYPEPVGRQFAAFELRNVQSFKTEIAPARTFGFMRDVERLQRSGLAAGGRLDNFILIGSDKVINTELRFENELARHKILDAIGDLFLIGRPLRAKVSAKMTGHSDNISILRKLFEELR
jgi:UDP-3-O-acyl N-acetylglucosamine deacetylase